MGTVDRMPSILSLASNGLVVGRASTAASYCGVYCGVCQAAGPSGHRRDTSVLVLIKIDGTKVWLDYRYV